MSIEEGPDWYHLPPFMQKKHYCLIDFHLSLPTELMYAKQEATVQLSTELKHVHEPLPSMRSLRAEMIF